MTGSMQDRERPHVLAHERFRADRAAMSGLNLTERFARIHETNLWGASTSASGLGSELPATAGIARLLPTLLRELDVATLLDAPCGDAKWIATVELPGVDYIGVDIVPALVEQNRRDRGDLGRFIMADLTREALPRADLILCRDCLVHLSFANIALVAQNFVASGARWLLTTTFPEWQSNGDCDDGDWRPLNLEQAPFEWPAPIRLLNEECREAGGGWADKSLGLWNLQDLPRS